jgi:hypothetical protein
VELLLMVLALVLLDVLAYRFGEDSRVMDPRRRGPSLFGG